MHIYAYDNQTSYIEKEPAPDPDYLYQDEQNKKKVDPSNLLLALMRRADIVDEATRFDRAFRARLWPIPGNGIFDGSETLS
ncbi:MAG: hypothetical protein PHN51_10435 [Candidatus Nanopelagicales bacterium]|nr:hypothetical protein [Candidatus Nanopelagicales bacterium]